MTDDLATPPFPSATEADWRAAVDLALKGKPFEKTLVGRTADGLRIEPLYARADKAVPLAGRVPGAPWAVVQRLDHPDPEHANTQALEDLEGGASGLALILAGAPRARFGGLAGDLAGDLSRALDGVMLDLISTRIESAPFASRAAALAFASLVATRKLDPAGLDVDFGLDPIGDAAATGDVDVARASLPEVGLIAKDLISRGFLAARFARADGRAIHDAGGTHAQELGFALACALAYLRSMEASGIDLDTARRGVGFLLAADADQFATTAKFRAMRHLWARVEEACALAPRPVAIAGETSWRMTAAVDPAVNWLRATLACFAAGTAGANAITVLPWTMAIGLPDAFARRIARNTQSILLEESHLHRVADPAAGSGGIEALTMGLAEAAWAAFQRIETAGGALVALATGLVQGEVAKARADSQHDIATRRAPLVGASDFPNLAEKPPEVLSSEPAPLAAGPRALPAIRLSAPFEALRTAARSLAGPAKVHLAALGPVSATMARATFAKNLFEAGGLSVAMPDGEADLARMGDAFRESGAWIACLCSSDEIYAQQAADAARALRNAGARFVWLAGRPGEQEAAWRAAGVDEFIFVGRNVLECLSVAHAALGQREAQP